MTTCRASLRWRATGSTYRRCSCRDRQTGCSLGTACPKLANRRHGIWYYRLELPPDAAGQRRPRRRGGFTGQTDAEAELDQARTLLAIPRPMTPTRSPWSAT